MEYISSAAITFITWFSKYLKAQWVNNGSKDDLHMNDVCEWECVTEEGCLSIVGPGRFAPLCPHSKDQVRFSGTKGQVEICSARTPKTLIVAMLYGGFSLAACKNTELPAGCRVYIWIAVTCAPLPMLWSPDYVSLLYFCYIRLGNVC